MRHKDSGSLQFNFISLSWEIPEFMEDSPSEAWIQGWDANMHGGINVNPFDTNTQEAIDWQDGWDCAEVDL